MTRIITERIKVKTGGVVEMCYPELPEGFVADVILIVESSRSSETDQSSVLNLSGMFGASSGMFQTQEGADKYLLELHEDWERPWYPENG